MNRPIQFNLKNYSINKFIFLPMVLYPLVPFISILLFVFTISLVEKTGKGTLYILFFLLALFLGLINGTKVPESDLINYYERFEAAGFTPLFEYLLLQGKEPFFYGLTYILYYLTKGDSQVYIVIITTIAYFIYFASLYRYYKKVSGYNGVIIFSVILAAFFPQLFSLSAHVLRQFLAASILFYAIVEKLFYSKRAWPYFLIAFLTHSTALFFIPLLYIKQLNNKLNIKTLTLISIILIFIGFYLEPISNYLLGLFGNNMLTYVLSRVAQKSYYELGSLNFTAYLLLIVLNLIVLILLNKKKSSKLLDRTKGFTHFSNIFLILSIFILANINQAEIAIRFFFFAYFFFPYILPLIFTSRQKEIYAVRFLISLLIIFGFILNLKYGTWQYAPLDKLLLFNPIFIVY